MFSCPKGFGQPNKKLYTLSVGSQILPHNPLDPSIKIPSLHTLIHEMDMENTRDILRKKISIQITNLRNNAKNDAIKILNWEV